MSEQERETELVAGTIGGITQKKADTWTVAVTPEGSQYAKNLWTKDVDLVEGLSAKIGQHGSFVVAKGAPYTVQGKEVRSWWIQSAEDAPELSDLHIKATVSPSTAPSSEGMSKEEWARKDAAIHEMACIKTAAAALTHTIPSDPTPEDLNKFLGRVAALTGPWMRAVLSVRDGEEVPFE